MSEPRNCESNSPAKAYQQLRYNERETKKKKKQTKHTFPNQFVESIFCLAPHELGCFHFLESSLSN